MSVVALPGRLVRTTRRRLRGVSYRRRPTLEHVISQPCTFDQIQSASYAQWCERLQTPVLHHRKTWEWVYIVAVLDQHRMLEPGRTGVGFGVGTEPMTPYFASRDVEIVATDLGADEPAAAAWAASNEHAAELADLNRGDLCDPELFGKRVSFRPVDMRAIPDDLRRGTFDFTWSSCAMEHLGSLDAGLEFLKRQLECLKPGGVGVHTTEYNVEAEGGTIADGPTVLYQRAQIEALTYAMRRDGHKMTTTFAVGTAPEDLHLDRPPYTNTHIRVETGGFPHTSFGIVIQKSKR